MKKKLTVIFCLLFLFSFPLAGCIDRSSDNETANASRNKGDLSFTLGETFKFDRLEVTFGQYIHWGTVSNTDSDKYGSKIFHVAITTTNISDLTSALCLYSFLQFGPSGAVLKCINHYFDDSIKWGGFLYPSSTRTSNIYFLYDGNGDYFVEFGFWGNTEAQVHIPIEGRTNRFGAFLS